MTIGPRISVCVSTYNRARLLDRLLGRLADQDVPDQFEVCICDNGSSDATADVLAAWGQRLDLRSTRLEVNAGPAGGRNAAWRLARGEIVTFTDDDCLPTRGWLRAHAATHDAASGPLVVVGRVEPTPDERSLEGRFSRTVRVRDARFFETCNVSYRRSSLVTEEGFDETFRTPAGEDTDLGLRCLERGADAVFCEEALVHHGVRPSSLRASLRETVRWTDIPLVFAKHPSARATLAHRRIFWKRSHPVTILAVAGLLAAPRRPLALVLLLPWYRFRRTVWPVGRTSMPGRLLLDAVEVATMVRGSLRHRTPML